MIKQIKNKGIAADIGFVFIIILLFVSLAYSTSLQLICFEEQTISGVSPDTLWHLGSYSGDSEYYLAMVDDLDNGIAPYKYRILPVLVVRGIIRLAFWLGYTVTPAAGFVIMNTGISVLVGVGFTLYLIRFMDFSKPLALLGGVLSVTSLSMMRTLLFPMVDPAAMLCALLIFWAIQEKSIPLFVVSSVIALLTKEVFIVAAPLWWVHQEWKHRSVAHLLAGFAPLVLFAIIRALMGSSPLEVNYGFDVMAGQFPAKYIGRLLTPQGRLMLLVRVALSFGFLWVGIVNIRRDTFLLKSFLVMVPLVLIAAFALSSRIARVLGVLYPVIIPMFLLYVKKREEPL